MHLKNSLISINEFFYSAKDQIRKLYLKSNLYNSKISNIEISKSQSLDDKLLGCIAIIITGLSYENEKFLNGLKKINVIIH